MATNLITTDRINALFTDLEVRKNLLTKCTDLYKTLSSHFELLQQTLDQKTQALDSKIEAFESQTQKTLDSLKEREESIPERESSAAARIEELKALAISEIENSDGQYAGTGEFGDALRSCCRRMDVEALVRFLLSKRKESVTLRAEITAAIAEAVDMERLLVDVVEAFVEAKAGKAGVADKRWACGVLMQAVFPVGDLVGVGRRGIARAVVERAVKAAERWREVMGGEVGESSLGAGEAAMFLHLVCGFGLREKFEEEFLRKLVVEHAARRDMVKIAMALGFGEKMTDIIEKLVKGGKEIEGVYFAFESGLTERFRPTALLKLYLSNSRKRATAILKNGNSSAAAMEQAETLELNACKAIIKCVEDHKLESEFTIDNLRKRVSQLEKARAEKKKSAVSTNKPLNKRARGGGGRDGGPPSFRPAKTGRFSNFSPSFGRRNLPQAHQTPAGRYPAPYNYPSQGMYEGPGSVSYGSGYGATHSQSPAAIPQQYPFASQDVGAGGAHASGSYGGQTNYGAYDYSAAAAPAPTYPPSYPQ